jgi:hypothetical protein
MSSSQLYTGLEYIAAALIFLPEPTTTFIGVGLLGYARSQKNGEQSSEVVYRYRNRFRDVYTYSVEMRDGSCIDYRISGIKPGQMPRRLPNTNKLESYHYFKNNKASALPQRKPFSGLQQGLLSNPVAGAGYSNSVVARGTHKQKKAT